MCDWEEVQGSCARCRCAQGLHPGVIAALITHSILDHTIHISDVYSALLCLIEQQEVVDLSLKAELVAAPQPSTAATEALTAQVELVKVRLAYIHL